MDTVSLISSKYAFPPRMEKYMIYLFSKRVIMKKILILGANGFIGHHIVQQLKDKYHITIATRESKDNGLSSIYCDFSKDFEVALWEKRVKGFDVVINAVGIIGENGKNSFENLHYKTPIAIFKASQNQKVKRIIQISALGVKEGATTQYYQSKLKADNFLKELSIEYMILKPSIVYGEGGKSTILFKALANLPIIPIIESGEQRLQPVFIDDLTQLVDKTIEMTTVNQEIAVVGKESITYQEMLFKFRTYLGKKPTITVKMPNFLAIFGKFFGEEAISKESITMLKEENFANKDDIVRILKREPKSMDEVIFNHQAPIAEKLYSQLYFLRFALRLIIAFVWIWSGVVSAFLYPQNLALELLNDVGISGVLALPTLYFASFLDITIGLFIALNYQAKNLAYLSLIVIMVYTLILTILAPHHWLHPFGCVLKNLPLLVLIYIYTLLERYR